MVGRKTRFLQSAPAWSMRLLVGLLVMAGGLGCGRGGPPTTHLEGRITVDGQPIKEGNLSFVALEPNRGRGSTANIAEGRYSAREVPLGRVLVYFNATKATGRTVIVSNTPVPEILSVIPEKYNAGMEIEVIEGRFQQDFHLVSR
ncbi:MAG: hypothetical protein KKE86_09135 [Planctomycetes bacterium]|nr:hypothetical protein [Planctomycetota bacterium]MBU4399483.1 hypothetical protein [Planctomycetota bacterium]MCG2685483.1 hypothetical protein [Planctomycetales bacterium]